MATRTTTATTRTIKTASPAPPPVNSSNSRLPTSRSAYEKGIGSRPAATSSWRQAGGAGGTGASNGPWPKGIIRMKATMVGLSPLHPLKPGRLRRSVEQLGLQEHLRPPFVARVEVVVGLWRLFQRQAVRDDERGLRAAGLDQIPQPTVVGLDVALAHAEPQTLLPEGPPVKRELSALLQRIG